MGHPPGPSARSSKPPSIQQGPDEEGHCSGDGRTAAGSGPCWLAASGTLYVVPGAGITTAYWTCQALIHYHAKLASASCHGTEEQTVPGTQAAARLIRIGSRDTPGRLAPSRTQQRRRNAG